MTQNDLHLLSLAERRLTFENSGIFIDLADTDECRSQLEDMAHARYRRQDSKEEYISSLM